MCAVIAGGQVPRQHTKCHGDMLQFDGCWTIQTCQFLYFPASTGRLCIGFGQKKTVDGEFLNDYADMKDFILVRSVEDF